MVVGKYSHLNFICNLFSLGITTLKDKYLVDNFTLIYSIVRSILNRFLNKLNTCVFSFIVFFSFVLLLFFYYFYYFFKENYVKLKGTNFNILRILNSLIYLNFNFYFHTNINCILS